VNKIIPKFEKIHWDKVQELIIELYPALQQSYGDLESNLEYEELQLHHTKVGSERIYVIENNRFEIALIKTDFEGNIQSIILYPLYDTILNYRFLNVTGYVGDIKTDDNQTNFIDLLVHKLEEEKDSIESPDIFEHMPERKKNYITHLDRLYEIQKNHHLVENLRENRDDEKHEYFSVSLRDIYHSKTF
jgi:hypothetical protein